METKKLEVVNQGFASANELEIAMRELKALDLELAQEQTEEQPFMVRVTVTLEVL